MNESSLILPLIQHKVVLLVLRTVFALAFWLPSLLHLSFGQEYLCRYEMVRRQFCSICVPMFTYVLALHFKVNLTSILYSEFYGQDLLQTCRYETRELWGLFAEVREKSVLEFPRFWHFFFNICQYLKLFYTYKKINTISFKLHHSLLRVPKIIEIGEIVPAEKRDSKTYITHARIKIGSGHFKGNTQQ